MQQRAERRQHCSGCESSSSCALLVHGINVSWSKRMRYAIFLVLAASVSASAQTIALSHANVIDGTGAAPVRDATIVISGGRITAVGPADKVKAPAGAQVIDLTGKIIIPGIINAHSHISDD